MSDLIVRMKSRLADWEDEEPRADWFSSQREYGEAADEIEALRAEVEGLRGVLTHLEMANEALAAKRSRETYLAMEAEARDELIMLDEARRKARRQLYNAALGGYRYGV